MIVQIEPPTRKGQATESPQWSAASAASAGASNASGADGSSFAADKQNKQQRLGSDLLSMAAPNPLHGHMLRYVVIYW